MSLSQFASTGLLFLLGLGMTLPATARPRMPNIVIVSVDTLRADRLSAYGYERPTSPHIDRFFAQGARFTAARTVEPLTNPALASMLTSLYPHEHGATRNGLRLRPDLDSLPSLLRGRGFATAAFVGGWPLRDELSGLAEHFDDYHEVLTRKRWFLFKREATADDLNAAALDWLEGHRNERPGQPFLVWVHYVEPHAPYRQHDELRAQLGLSNGGRLGPGDRYDTEVAKVDQAIGELLGAVARLAPPEETLAVVTADHGESLGEHGYWGHGRHLYDPTLQIPLGIAWRGKIAPARISAPTLLIDLPPTLLGLIGHPVPEQFRGHDWSPALLDGTVSPPDRALLFQAHKGAVQSPKDAQRARRRGLLEIGLLTGDRKEIFRPGKKSRFAFDLTSDPDETASLVPPSSPISESLEVWSEVVSSGLEAADALPADPLEGESLERLRALGYLD